jgi:hypothetical protein
MVSRSLGYSAVAAIALLLAANAAEARNYCRSTVSGRFITRSSALADRGHAKCVPELPGEWSVIRWPEGNCEVWHNDAPPLNPVVVLAVAASPLEAWAKLQAAYARQLCR